MVELLTFNPPFRTAPAPTSTNLSRSLAAIASKTTPCLPTYPLKPEFTVSYVVIAVSRPCPPDSEQCDFDSKSPAWATTVLPSCLNSASRIWRMSSHHSFSCAKQHWTNEGALLFRSDPFMRQLNAAFLHASNNSPFSAAACCLHNSFMLQQPNFPRSKFLPHFLVFCIFKFSLARCWDSITELLGSPLNSNLTTLNERLGL